MSKCYVLITGSRSITHSANIPLLIDSLVKRGVEIVVGDAPGVDRLVVAKQ
jgi:predicted Rossmann fold nucleotide-binding protein DprA/Smf involved in DNA uptake